jgi:pectin lyase
MRMDLGSCVGAWTSTGLVVVAGLVASVQAQAATVIDGSVTTIVGVDAGRCLGVKGNSTAAGALLQSQACSGSSFQSWKFVREPSGWYQLVNVGSGQCIDVPGASRTNGTDLQQWNCSAGDWQRWNPSDQNGGQFALLSKSSGMGIDVYGASNADGARVVQWTWHGGTNQKWRLPTARVSDGSGPASGSVVTLKGVQAGNCVGIKGSSKTSGATLQSQSCSGSEFQQWKALQDAAGDYELVNVGSGQCMDVPGASGSGGVKIQQWGCGGGAWQKWQFRDDGAGHRYLVSKSSGLALDVLDQSLANGAAIVQWTYWGGANQQWISTVVGGGTPGSAPVGFGAGTTGGANGQVVTVTTPSQLAYELCRTRSGSTCTDATPRIIQVSGTIDFRRTEGTHSASGCYVAQCAAPMQSEYILGSLGACDGKPTFNVTLDSAGPTPLTVGSNKTLIGLGSTAAIKGKGLSLRGGVSNVIIRNLTISDINAQVVWGGDAITLDDADQVWIDHNRFAMIGRQMIVSGWGKASRVTVSWNEFDGRTPYSASCDGTHYWMMLMIGANDTITLSNNWVHHFGGRAPHVGTENAKSSLHMVNNYFQTSNGHALDASGALTSVLAEGNHWGDVNQPVPSDDDGLVMAPLTTMSSEVATACKNALRRGCVGNTANPMPAGGSAAFATHTGALSPFNGLSAPVLPTPYPAADVPRVVPASVGPGRL